MKINPGWNPVGKNVRVPDNAVQQHAPTRNFADVMKHNEETASKEQLNRLAGQINKQGELLSKAMTVRELRKYKLLVKQFLEETARRGVTIKETRGWDRRGRSKRYKILDEIDEELIALAEGLLDSEQGRIEILQKIGEIRGMLINFLY